MREMKRKPIIEHVFGMSKKELAGKLGVDKSGLEAIERKLKENEEFWRKTKIETTKSTPDIARGIREPSSFYDCEPIYYVAKHEDHGEVGFALVEENEVGSFIHTKPEHRRKGVGLVLAIKQIIDRPYLHGELTEDGEKLWKRLRDLGIKHIEIFNPSIMSSKKLFIYHRDPNELKKMKKKLADWFNLWD